MIVFRFLKDLAAIAAAAAFAAAVVGCKTTPTSTPGAAHVFVAYNADQPHEIPYIIDPPDEITVKASGLREIDNVKAVVRPDGKVALNLLGEVHIAGLTPEQACDHLKSLAVKYYHDPDIKLEILARSKFYMVFGPGAATPSRKAFTGNDTVLSAIAEAGFIYTQAWPQKVSLSRPGKHGAEPQTAVIDFTRIFERGDLTQNYVLEEGDILNIPDSPLAHFNSVAGEIFGPLTSGSNTGNSLRTTVRPGQ